MILVIRGLRTERLDFTRAMSKGSRALVVGFILLMISSTMCCVMVEKQHRGLLTPGSGSTIQTAEAGELQW